MGDGSKKQSPLWDARKADTEKRILTAATRLFIAEGYVATTLAAVAAEAFVGVRTVYLRFGSKAELLKRVIEVAICADTEYADSDSDSDSDCDWAALALAAPSLEERVHAYACGVRSLVERVGPLVTVAAEAESSEPGFVEAAQSARRAIHASVATIWERFKTDGLLSAAVDLDWVIATASVLGQPETYVLMTRTLEYDAEAYQVWLERMWLQMATVPGPAVARSAHGAA
ncbi:TetR/AcrR family transcriptional regulator [Nocardia sp. CY41]|uniref:TetR/AcrR family transcriptional regulator n=1 Tax=Nocardia sp. CY41 TaxID=2608686 RepID=UPI00135794D8|nr:TetR/AcrR family transcriptional regulator [Nocardia sp. CY41]